MSDWVWCFPWRRLRIQTVWIHSIVRRMGVTFTPVSQVCHSCKTGSSCSSAGDRSQGSDCTTVLHPHDAWCCLLRIQDSGGLRSWDNEGKPEKTERIIRQLQTSCLFLRRSDHFSVHIIFICLRHRGRGYGAALKKKKKEGGNGCQKEYFLLN